MRVKSDLQASPEGRPYRPVMTGFDPEKLPLTESAAVANEPIGQRALPQDQPCTHQQPGIFPVMKPPFSSSPYQSSFPQLNYGLFNYPFFSQQQQQFRPPPWYQSQWSYGGNGGMGGLFNMNPYSWRF